MVKVTILGAGITGMMAAAKLPRDYDITIVADLLPGDYDTKAWASPYAGAIWVGVHQSKTHEQRMQLDGLAGLWRLTETHPESSVHRIEMMEIMDHGSQADVWYAGKVPDFRFVTASELPKGAMYGMKYQTVVLTPTVFLLWLYERLKSRGVQFQRIQKVDALEDLRDMGHNVLINASGFGCETLRDLQEKNLTAWRLQCVVAKAPNQYNRLFIRRGLDRYYSTAYCGGVLAKGSNDLTVSEESRAKICRNAHLNQPDVFSSPDPKDWDILYDHVGIYPTIDYSVAGVRCEKEVLDGQRVTHAHGQNAGGYVYSFGLAKAVVGLVDGFLLESTILARL